MLYYSSIQNIAYAKIIIDANNITSIAKETSFFIKYSVIVRASDGICKTALKRNNDKNSFRSLSETASLNVFPLVQKSLIPNESATIINSNATNKNMIITETIFLQFTLFIIYLTSYHNIPKKVIDANITDINAVVSITQFV
jgi:hypothetical protein